MRGHRAALVAIIVIALALIAIPIVTSLVPKTQGTENLTDSLRPAFAPAALEQTRSDMSTMSAMAADLEKALPAIADALGMSPEELNSFIGSTFPAVAEGVSQLGDILAYFDGLVGGLEAQAGNFRLADQIPTSNLPATSVPFLFFIPGAILLLAGAVGLLAPGSARGVPAWLAVVLGVALIVGPLVLSVPGKTTAVDELTDAFRPVFTQEGAAQTRAYMDTTKAMSDELVSDMLPGLAEALQMSPEQLNEFLGGNFPDLAAGVSQLGEMLPRFEGLVAGIETNIENFQDADSIPTSSLPATTLLWLFVVPAAALVGSRGRGAGASSFRISFRSI